jgi:hypothetical protein
METLKMFQTTNQMSLGGYKHSSQNPCWTGCTVSAKKLQSWTGCTVSAKIAIMMRPIWTVHHHAALDQMLDPRKRLTTRPGVICFFCIEQTSQRFV